MNPLAAAVHGARFVRHEPRSRRVFVWKDGALVVDVVDEDTGEVRGSWPMAESSAEAAEALVQDRISKGY